MGTIVRMEKVGIDSKCQEESTSVWQGFVGLNPYSYIVWVGIGNKNKT